MGKLLARHNWRTLAGLLAVSRSPIDLFCRRYLGTGAYPVSTRLRTPIGPLRLTLHSRADVITLSEVFFRRDYPADETLKVAIDFGANIGIASAWFLTRNRRARVHAFEPVPVNLERARANLEGFGPRVRLHAAAVADRTGRVAFGVESSGRYGGIGVSTGRQIEVDCLDGADVVAAVLAEDNAVDILKIDVEGMEAAILRRIGPLAPGRIGRIYAEYPGDDIDLPGFMRSRNLSIAVWRAASWAAVPGGERQNARGLAR
jgi:FkbM family methyltransferase